MSSILYVCPSFAIDTPGDFIYDLIKEFTDNGHILTVIIPTERRNKEKTHIEIYSGYRVVKIWTLNYRGKVNLLEKGFSTLLMGYLVRKALRKFCKKDVFALSIFQTLPITYRPAIRYLKSKKSFIYLLHKDIFPQSAIDLGIFSSQSFSYRLFRLIEKRLYSICDMIGVMTEKNASYILEQNPELNKSKVEVCPNALLPFQENCIRKMKLEQKKIREKYDIPHDKVVFVYGGNISRAQGISFIEQVVKNIDSIENTFLLFIGSGNEFVRLKSIIEINNVSNAMIINFLSKAEYDQLVSACDVGLVFLDYRFTIANIPSRTLAYINLGLPVVAATDNFTDYRDIIEENKIGLWSPSNDIGKFLSNIDYLSKNPERIIEYGSNARTYLHSAANVKIPYNIIIKHISL